MVIPKKKSEKYNKIKHPVRGSFIIYIEVYFFPS